MQQFNQYIQQLSPHLFWDVDKNLLDSSMNLFVIQRVLEYGLINDWLLTKNFYGIHSIKEKVVQIPVLDKISLHFLCATFDLKKEDFKCYTKNQLINNYWNY